MRNVVLLGATGSIGHSTLRVLRAHKDRLQLVGVAAKEKHQALASICSEFKVGHAVLQSEDAYLRAEKAGYFPSNTQLSCGSEALESLASLPDADLVLVAIVGTAGLRPTLAAIEAGKDIALANKELLVLGGAHVMEAARRRGVRLLPTDSEHNAIFQCLERGSIDQVDKLILTASGGQFHNTPKSELDQVTPDVATQHPNWSMGPKITVDSATMANKGLELIEAHWLFGLEADRLEVVIHPQSIVHSFVQQIDGSILAQLSPPSMTFAIQHCLLYPDRAPSVEPTIDFTKALQLDFEAPNYERYPCLRLAYEALRSGGAAPAIYNAANEVAVERFLNKEIAYLDIPKIIEHSLSKVELIETPSLDQLLETNNEARLTAKALHV
ncbi:MAG: 1-deoxy-D-xylulose-5-phosphate reductoisomerase [Verrucomicrobiota bacterium]|nr:1-deoxy-D-xylulose-5-phosphate reductoisomerase [Verrucomicrobiota bacterium]